MRPTRIDNGVETNTWTMRSEPAGVHVAQLLPRRATYRCGACGYGAVLPAPAVHSCPMCRSTRWLPDARTSRGDLAGDLT